jgi:hypothetical protein
MNWNVPQVTHTSRHQATVSLLIATCLSLVPLLPSAHSVLAALGLSVSLHTINSPKMAQNIGQGSFARRLCENSMHRTSKDGSLFSHPPSVPELTTTTPCVTSDRELLEEWEEELTRFELLHQQKDEPQYQMQQD